MDDVAVRIGRARAHGYGRLCGRCGRGNLDHPGISAVARVGPTRRRRRRVGLRLGSGGLRIERLARVGLGQRLRLLRFGGFDGLVGRRVGGPGIRGGLLLCAQGGRSECEEGGCQDRPIHSESPSGISLGRAEVALMVQTPPATESFARLRKNRERKRQLTKLRLSRAGQAGYAGHGRMFLKEHESGKVPSAMLPATGLRPIAL